MASETGRKKVPLPPGRGLFDWVKLVNGPGASALWRAGLPADYSPPKPLTMSEVHKHNGVDGAASWIVLRGVVYNVTQYIEYHPGGKVELLRGVGRDCTHLFDTVHAWVNVDGFLKHCAVGALEQAEAENVTKASFSAPTVAAASSSSLAPPGTMGPPPARGKGKGKAGWTTPIIPKKGRLVSMDDVSPDTKLYRLKLDDDVVVPDGWHVMLRATVGGKLVARPMTPVNAASETRRLDFVIKHYDDGLLTGKFFPTVSLGDEIAFTVPSPITFALPASKTKLGLIGGGTGITPMIKIMESRHGSDGGRIHTVTVNRTDADVLLRDRVEASSDEVYHHISSTAGRLTRDVLKDHLPPPAADVLILYCGPVLLNNALCLMLDQLGYGEDMVHGFV